ncbi:hypothetical protein SprV_0702386700 [Sparganum proliferum]
MRQESNQCVSDFITNLTLAIQDCGYKEIKADNFEHTMLVQQLIVGLRNEKARGNLSSEKKDLSWEKACDIASHQERVRQNLQQLNQSNDGVIASLESEMAVSLVNTAVSSPRQRPSAADNGPAFTSAEFKDFMEKNGIRHLTTAPYHAASNGLAERAVQTIKHGLVKQTEADLATKLSRFLFSYRITPNDLTGASPAELMFKRQLRTRLDLLNPSTHDRVIAKQTKMKARYDANTRPRVVAPNESVYTRVEHETNWCPAVVRTSEGQIVELELEDGRIVRRHLDQVRSRTDPVTGGFGKFELPETLDRDPDIPRTEHLLPAQSITTPAEAYVPPPPSTPASTSLEAEDPVTAQSGAEVENTALRRSTRIRKPVQRFQDESY